MQSDGGEKKRMKEQGESERETRRQTEEKRQAIAKEHN